MDQGIESTYRYDTEKGNNIQDPITPRDEIFPGEEVDGKCFDSKNAQYRYSIKCLIDDMFEQLAGISNDAPKRQATPFDDDRVDIISDKISDADVVISSDNESAPSVS
eukprot:Seg8677.1 transcript_id=Seg8677.1/GoldUCD/mRNA.D3Y31 product="hypothetical protein" protein_id=Seg8677.1/GoldUCD/D3Y31